MKRLLRAVYVSLTLVMLSLTGLASSTPSISPSYDRLPITPDTWQEVDLTYTDTIKGKPYPGKIKLLRPKQYLKDRGMDKQGSSVTLPIPEFGINDINVTVAGIKNITLDTSQVDWSKQISRPVIGTFKRYAPIVNTYTFKDRHGNVTKINATPNHPFYVKNKHAFMPIEDVSATDQLVTEMGKSVHLVCPQDKRNHCGKRYNQKKKPIPVYNLEVYQQHVYFVGINKFLVHNNCKEVLEKLRSKITDRVSVKEFLGMDINYLEEMGISKNLCLDCGSTANGLFEKLSMKELNWGKEAQLTLQDWNLVLRNEKNKTLISRVQYKRDHAFVILSDENDAMILQSNVTTSIDQQFDLSDHLPHVSIYSKDNLIDKLKILDSKSDPGIYSELFLMPGKNLSGPIPSSRFIFLPVREVHLNF